MGELYYNGHLYERNYQEAFKHYSKSYELFSDNGYIEFRLGRCYYFGHGVEMDSNKAYVFLTSAKNKDFSDAKEFLNEHFETKH